MHGDYVSKSKTLRANTQKADMATQNVYLLASTPVKYTDGKHDEQMKYEVETLVQSMKTQNVVDSDCVVHVCVMKTAAISQKDFFAAFRAVNKQSTPDAGKNLFTALRGANHTAATNTFNVLVLKEDVWTGFLNEANTQEYTNSLFQYTSTTSQNQPDQHTELQSAPPALDKTDVSSARSAAKKRARETAPTAALPAAQQPTAAPLVAEQPAAKPPAVQQPAAKPPVVQQQPAKPPAVQQSKPPRRITPTLVSAPNQPPVSGTAEAQPPGVPQLPNKNAIDLTGEKEPKRPRSVLSVSSTASTKTPTPGVPNKSAAVQSLDERGGDTLLTSQDFQNGDETMDVDINQASSASSQDFDVLMPLSKSYINNYSQLRGSLPDLVPVFSPEPLPENDVDTMDVDEQPESQSDVLPHATRPLRVQTYVYVKEGSLPARGKMGFYNDADKRLL